MAYVLYIFSSVVAYVTSQALGLLNMLLFLLTALLAYLAVRKFMDKPSIVHITSEQLAKYTSVSCGNPECVTCKAWRKTRIPLEMVLECPSCGEIHVDVGEYATKPHITHLCMICGTEFTPSDYPTVGVQRYPGPECIRCSGTGIEHDEGPPGAQQGSGTHACPCLDLPVDKTLCANPKCRLPVTLEYVPTSFEGDNGPTGLYIHDASSTDVCELDEIGTPADSHAGHGRCLVVRYQ